MVRQTATASPSVERIYQAQATTSVSRFKAPYVVPAAIGILLALGAVVLIVYITRTDATRTFTASVSDIEPASTQQPQVQPSAQASSSDFQITSDEPIPKGNKPTHVADPRPTEYNSLPTGTRIVDDIGTDGHGELAIENGTGEDAVVYLTHTGMDFGETVRGVFVQAHSTARMPKIPEGSYRLVFTTGLNWIESEDTFIWHSVYSEFERTFDFSEQRDADGVHYHSISVTLHTVPMGNVRTKSITRAEFLKGHKHIALQR